MKKLIFIAFLLLFFSPLLNQNKAGAVTPPTASNLDAEATCTGTDSFITFRFYVQKQDNSEAYLWYTGNTDNGGNGTIVGEGYWLTEEIHNLPYNKTYDWHIAVHDTGICLWNCWVQTSGPQITSKDCSTSPPSTTYDCNTTNYQCVVHSGSGSGSYSTLIGCQNSCIAPLNVYNCSRRDPRCADTSTYTTCQDFPYSIAWSCQPPDCAMSNTSGSDSTKWTHSCAYNKNRPTPAYCHPGGDTHCSSVGIERGDCCDGYVCDPPGANTIALGDGTCIAASPSLGDLCYTCLPGNNWNSAIKKCVSSSGIVTDPVSKVYCITGQNCVQGQGCKVPPPTSNPTQPPVNFGGAFSGNVGTFSCGSGANAVWTLGCIFPIIASIIGWLIAFAGSIAVILIIYAGIRIITANGDPKTIAGGKRILEFAIIGLVIVFMAFFIIRFIATTTGVACIDPRRPLSFTVCQ